MAFQKLLRFWSCMLPTLAALAGTSFLLAADPDYLPKIVVVGKFGDADNDNIAAVLKSAAAELAQYAPERRDDLIRVAHSEEGPIVLYERGPNREHQVLLNVEGRFWSQFAYQYAHEHCHILCNYRAGKNPNKWFEESLCELASVFVLRKMATTWRERPPYPNWRDYHQALADYVAKHVEGKGLPKGKSLARWYQEHAAELRKTATDRPRNQVVALALLPHFERQPEQWAAVQYLNAQPSRNGQSFAEYLQNWRDAAPEKSQAFIGRLAAEFEVTLAEPNPAQP